MKKYTITIAKEVEQSKMSKKLGAKITAIGEDSMQVSDGYHTMDELYAHRVSLFVCIARSIQAANKFARMSGHAGIPIWKSWVNSDGAQYEGWFIMGIFLEAGKQITYHLPASRWEECSFADFKHQAPEWDGHTSADVLERLKTL